MIDYALSVFILRFRESEGRGWPWSAALTGQRVQECRGTVGNHPVLGLRGRSGKRAELRRDELTALPSDAAILVKDPPEDSSTGELPVELSSGG